MSDYTPRTTETLPDGYNYGVVLQTVISNLHSDADRLADQHVAFLAESFRARGWQFTPKTAADLRKPYHAYLIKLFADRLVEGLMDEDDEPPAIGRRRR
jgi:hypothetical protein